MGKIEVIDFIEDKELGFHEGNVVKYVARAKHKGNELQDLEKAEWYLKRAITNLKKRQRVLTVVVTSEVEERFVGYGNEDPHCDKHCSITGCPDQCGFINGHDGPGNEDEPCLCNNHWQASR